MNLPDKWEHLPYPVKVRILEYVQLDYDCYESSRAEAQEELLNDNSNYNGKVVQDFYSVPTNKQLVEVIVNQEITTLENQLLELKKLLG